MYVVVCTGPWNGREGNGSRFTKRIIQGRDVRNYRPVTVLSAVGKVLEQLLGKQLTIFMEPRLNNNLTAYRKKNSCETSLVKLVEDWKLTLDNKHVVGVVEIHTSR